MLDIENLHAGYGKIQVLKGLSLTIGQGEIVALIGTNGAGKTTLLKTISGLIRAHKGKIIYQGKEIQGCPAHDIVKQGLSCVPEGRRIFPRLTVKENLMMGSFNQKNKLETASLLEKAFALFPLLKERSPQLGGTLSGGEQQMLAIARGLMQSPKLLLLDEPSMGLAPLLIEKIFSAIKKLNQEGLTILLVEQNANLALRISQRGYVLEVGNIILQDKSSSLLQNDQVRKSYIGES